MGEQVNGSVTGTVDIKGQLSGAPAVSNYEKLNKKPQINGVELIGDKSFEDLGFDKVYATKETVEELQQTIDHLVDGNEVAY